MPANAAVPKVPHEPGHPAGRPEPYDTARRSGETVCWKQKKTVTPALKGPIMALTEGRHPRDAALPTPVVTLDRAQRTTRPVDYAWAIARITIGWVFLWAFLDKVFGWGFATPSERAWINGGSPTTGFLKGTSEHALGGLFSNLAGQAWVDWLFMIGLFGIGAALILGAGMRIAATTGGLLLMFMWAASLPLETNPFVDEHIVYAIVLAGLALTSAGDTLGIGGWWRNTRIVQRHPILK
jgi:thiosulfate dehydrogenase [quinone] large subunit